MLSLLHGRRLLQEHGVGETEAWQGVPVGMVMLMRSIPGR